MIFAFSFAIFFLSGLVAIFSLRLQNFIYGIAGSPDPLANSIGSVLIGGTLGFGSFLISLIIVLILKAFKKIPPGQGIRALVFIDFLVIVFFTNPFILKLIGFK